MLQSNQIILRKQVRESLKESPTQRVIITDIDDGRLSGNKVRFMLEPSDIITQHVIRDILRNVYDIIMEQKLTKRYLRSFSTDFVESYISENIDMHISNVDKYDTLQEQQQPENIKGDNMQPGSTMVEEKGGSQCDGEESLKESVRQGRVVRKMSTASKYSRTLSNNTNRNAEVNKGISAHQIVKLNQKNHQFAQLPEIHDPYVQELRRLKQLNPKVDLTRKRDKKSFLGDKMKLLQKISYDFTGDIIKIKQSNQNSTLFTVSIQSVQNQGQIIKHREVALSINLDSNRMKKDRLTSKNPLTQHSNNISFSNIGSLTPHLEIIDNARFIQGKTIVENKKTKQPSLVEIKKSMSLNKISRSQFSKLKDTNNGKKHLPFKGTIPSLPSLKNQESQLLTSDGNDKQFTDRQSKNNRLQVFGRQSNRKEIKSLPKSIDRKKSLKMTERSHERVSVENEELTEMLIDDKAQHWLDTRRSLDGGHLKQKQNLNPTNHQTHTPQLEQLTPRDIANLHYIKTSGTIGSIQLPKLQSVIFNPNSLLQSKSKIKSKQQQNQIQRLKKHFEDKLRV